MSPYAPKLPPQPSQRRWLRPHGSGCDSSLPAAELTVLGRWLSFGSARDRGASGRYRGTADMAGDRGCAVKQPPRVQPRTSSRAGRTAASARLYRSLPTQSSRRRERCVRRPSAAGASSRSAAPVGLAAGPAGIAAPVARRMATGPAFRRQQQKKVSWPVSIARGRAQPACRNAMVAVQPPPTCHRAPEMTDEVHADVLRNRG